MNLIVNRSNTLSQGSTVNPTNMLVVIDRGVDEPGLLASGVQPEASVLMLEPEADAMVQITTALAAGEYGSVHVLSHGTPGCIELINQRLTVQSLHPYRQMVMEWGVGEIWVYGCEVAAAPGVLELLHQWSGASIVASTQRVGQGQWEMDYRLGGTTSPLAIGPGLRKIYPGQFAPTYTENTVSVGTDPYSVAIADLDGDGDNDLVVANSTSNNISVLTNNGSGGFTQSTIAVGFTPRSVAIADLDGDGDNDLAVANVTSNTVSILLNNGAGSFIQGAVGVGGAPQTVVIGDLDGQEDNDLAVVNFSSNSISILISDGSGDFTQSTIAVGNGPQALAVGDLDGDGDNDLAVGNRDSDSISILENDGSGDFTQSTIAVGLSPTSVVIGDLDGQGDNDLAVANSRSNTISILKSDGSGGFTQSTVAVGIRPRAVAIGDLDGDGDNDLAVANFSAYSASILINNGDGDFTESTVSVGSLPVSVAIGDLDGDGDNDLAVTNVVPNTVSVLIECFLAGTRLLTEHGEINVEALAIGDRVQTADGNLEPIKWIGRQTCYPSQVQNPLRGYPILVKAGALGNGLPHRDLRVSPDHALLFEGLLINAGALVNGTSIVKTQPTEAFTYYHIELDKHALLVAEGTDAESYLPQKEDRLAYENGAEYEELYPNDNKIILWPLDYPRVSSYTTVPRYIRKKLNKIAAELGLVEKVA